MILIQNAGQLLTLSGGPGPRRGPAMRDLGIVENGAVLVDRGRIAAAGRIEIPPACDVYDAEGGVVMPGFVDSHTHLLYGPPRLGDYEMRLRGASYAEIASAGGGILSSVRAVREASSGALYEQAAEALARMAAYGTTTAEAKSGYGLDAASEIKMLSTLCRFGSRVVPTFLGAHVVPPEFSSADDYIDFCIRELMPRAAGLAQFADVYCDTGAFTVAQARRYLETARAHGFRLKIHAEQFARLGGVDLAVELGAASADHLECATASDACALAASTTIATVLPGAAFHLGLRHYAPARMLIDTGAAVALATDFNPGTSPTPSMQMVLSLACAQMRMDPAEAITAATINGAHALGLARDRGSLEPGKRADILVLGVHDYREIPYYFGVNHVRATMIEGEFIS